MKHSLSEYALYISFRLLSAFFQALPLRFSLFIGRALGMLGLWFDLKHRRIAYRNLCIAFSAQYSIPELKAILKRNYQNLGMNMVEALRIPLMDDAYIKRYIRMTGEENLENALKNKKGAIVLGAHFGSWEICFAIAGMLKYPFCVFAEEQSKNPLLDELLNRMRQSKGVEVLKVSGKIRQVVGSLKKNKFVGMVADHGARKGIFVDFFGRKTRAPSTAARIALRLGVPILIAYIRRVKGPEHELVIMPPLEIKRSGNFKQDMIATVEAINRLTEDYITKYPEQYFWFYKRFKYSAQRNILFLHDGKAGHLRQGETLIGLLENIAGQKGIELRTKLLKIDFNNRYASLLQSLGLTLAHRNTCQGCLFCLRRLLAPGISRELESYFADIVISCGWRTAAVNCVISSDRQSKSIALMRPGFLSVKRFDLVVMPYHDNPPSRNNVVVTQGALNLVDENYLQSSARDLQSQVSLGQGLVLGLLLGGDTKSFRLSCDLLKPLIAQIKLFLERHDGKILITTSRRTSQDAERLIRAEFGSYARCKLLVIANENNLPFAVGGILGLSRIVIVSPESISMISEAASSGRYVVVFKPGMNIGRRHSRFLRNLADKKYIYLTDSARLSETLEGIITDKPGVVKLEDNLKVKQALEKLLI
ncbi:ELM1/GtrOC1 family putative glycosyltransferase [Candidatus Omnitrophota bacterium]